MFDLERVEVLRGPQGTLYGRNATGGAVNLITAKPTETLDGYIRLTVGGDDLNLIGEAAVGGPLSENIRGRVAVRAVKRDGYGINEFTGNDIDNAKQFSTRAQWPAAGLMDTEIRCFIELEVQHGTKEVCPRVQT
jgi:iron complex outermembrane receptor protein